MFTLNDLEAIIAQRAKAGAGESYTASLLAGGANHCARKLGEEAIETVVAAVSKDRAELRKEAADLLFHLLVVLRSGGVQLSEVLTELEARTGQSGLAEKAARKPVRAK